MEINLSQFVITKVYGLISGHCRHKVKTRILYFKKKIHKLPIPLTKSLCFEDANGREEKIVVP